VREGAWVGRAPAGSGSGRHVEEWGCRRLERRGVPLLRRRQPLFRAGAWRRAAAGVAGVAGAVAARVHRPAARATVMKGGGGLSAARVALGAPTLRRREPHCRSGAWRRGRAANNRRWWWWCGGGGSPFTPAAAPFPPPPTVHLPHAAEQAPGSGWSRSGRRCRSGGSPSCTCTAPLRAALRGEARLAERVVRGEACVVGLSVLCAGCSHQPAASVFVLLNLCGWPHFGTGFFLSFLTSSGTTEKFSRRVALGVMWVRGCVFV